MIADTVKKLKLQSVYHLASAAAEYFKEPRYTITWMSRALETGALPDVVRKFCEKALAEPTPVDIPVEIRKAA